MASTPRTFPWSARAHELFDTGLGCNAIARELGVAASSVSGWAKREGLSFAHAQTAVATQARSVSLRERRQRLVERLYARAEANLDRLEASSYRYRVSLADHTETVEDPGAPAADELRHSQAVGNYLKSAAQLEAVDANNGSDDAKSLLARLGAALGVSSPQQPVDN